MEKSLFRKKVAQLYCGHFELSWSLLGQKIEVRLKIAVFLPILCFAAPLINTRGFGRKKWLVSLTTFVPVYYKSNKQIESVPLALQDAIISKNTTLKRQKMVFLIIFEFF